MTSEHKMSKSSSQANETKKKQTQNSSELGFISRLILYSSGHEGRQRSLKQVWAEKLSLTNQFLRY